MRRGSPVTSMIPAARGAGSVLTAGLPTMPVISMRRASSTSRLGMCNSVRRGSIGALVREVAGAAACAEAVGSIVPDLPGRRRSAHSASNTDSNFVAGKSAMRILPWRRGPRTQLFRSFPGEVTGRWETILPFAFDAGQVTEMPVKPVIYAM